MARKTFISYKHSESQWLRDEIIKKMGNDATYYQGETSDSPDLTDTSTENIKENLKDMMYSTSVTIVIISPNMVQSNWIDWEISYTLKEVKRGDKTSHSNGLVGVIKKINGNYDWIFNSGIKPDGCGYRTTDNSKLYQIIYQNRYNKIGEDKYACADCKIFDHLEGSYMSLIKEDEFMSNIKVYVENAYTKSQNLVEFDLTKEIN